MWSQDQNEWLRVTAHVLCTPFGGSLKLPVARPPYQPQCECIKLKDLSPLCHASTNADNAQKLHPRENINSFLLDFASKKFHLCFSLGYAT